MLNGIFDEDGRSPTLCCSACSVDSVVRNKVIVMGFEEGFAEAHHIDVLLEKEVGKFLLFI